MSASVRQADKLFSPVSDLPFPPPLDVCKMFALLLFRFRMLLGKLNRLLLHPERFLSSPSEELAAATTTLLQYLVREVWGV